MKATLGEYNKKPQKMSKMGCLGQVKFDFSEYVETEDIEFLDKEAYLYGKFYEVGTLDIEMYYKLQQGCLTIRLHSANIFPSDDSPGNITSPIL